LGHPLENLYAIDLTGEVVAQLEVPFSAAALGYFGDDPDDFNLYFMCQNDLDDTYFVRKMNPETGEFQDVFNFATPGFPIGGDISNSFNPLVWTFLSVMDDGQRDQVQIWEMNLNTRWIEIEPMEAVVPPGGNQAVDITISTTSMTPNNYYAWLQVNHNSIEQQFVLPLEIEVFVEIGEPYFNPVAETGLPYMIIIDEALFNLTPLVRGDEAAVFDGDLCVGSNRIDNEWPLEIIAWQTDGVHPGFTDGHPMRFRIWSNLSQLEVTATADYIVGDGTFDYGDLSEVTLISGTMARMSVPLQGHYFELVSTFVAPQMLNASFVFGNIENLDIVYQDDGDIFIPPFINTIGNIRLTEAYQLFCMENSTLSIEGNFVDPEMTYQLQANQCNWLGFPFNYNIPAELALEPILDQLLILEDDDGRFLIPNIINHLGSLQPGKGYFTFVSEEVTFQYNPGALMSLPPEPYVYEIPKVEGAPPSTGLPFVILVKMDEILLNQDPATIEAYDGAMLVGKARVQLEDDLTTIVTWGGSPTYEIDGYAAGHPINLVVYGSDGAKIPVKVESETGEYGVGAYSTIHLSGEILPREFSVAQGYPNPFNPSVTVPFTVPSSGEVSFCLYNVLGQEVFTTSQLYQAGYHSFHFTTGKSSSELVSGIYFLQIAYKGQVKTQKLMLLK